MVIAKVFYIKDVLKGDDKSIIRVEGKREIIKDEDWWFLVYFKIYILFQFLICNLF